jgi:ribosomal-protein-alanine N-acetyltransferase
MVTLKSERLVLRPLKESDAKDIANNMNHPGQAKYVPGPPYPYTIDNALEYIQSRLESSKNRIEWAIEFEGTVVGGINVHNLNTERKHCELGYAIGPNWQGKGFATEASRTILRYAFDELNVHFVSAGVYEDNEGSKKVLKKLGFSYVGCYKEEMYWREQYMDKHLFDVRKDEFKNQ